MSRGDHHFGVQDRFLCSLKERTFNAKTPREYACASAEYGVYLCRTGRLSDARQICANIRETYAGREDPEVYIWLMILESAASYYSNSSTREKTKLIRAYAVAAAMGLRDLRQYSAAWLAHQYFNSGEYAAMGIWLERSGLNSASDDSTKIRACLTIADALESAGMKSEANFWYTQVRDAAIRIGDRASLMASIENRAAMRLDSLWFRSISDPPSSEEVEQVELEMLGGLEFERVTNTEALLPMAPVWRSRLAVLKNDYENAWKHATVSADSVGEFVNTITATADLDLLWICHKIGMKEEAKRRFLSIGKGSDLMLSRDDAAVYWFRLSQLDFELGEGLNCAHYGELSRQAKDLYSREMSVLRSVIDTLNLHLRIAR